MADTWVVQRMNCTALPQQGGARVSLTIMSNKWGKQ
jgi:hypothetical protein